MLLIKGAHCLERWESALYLKSVINLLSWKIGGINGIFLLLKNVFNMDQYVLGLVLRSSNFFAAFEKYLFFKLAINELSWLCKDLNVAKDWLILLLLRKLLVIAFFSLIKCLTWMFTQGGRFLSNVTGLWDMKLESIFLMLS